MKWIAIVAVTVIAGAALVLLRRTKPRQDPVNLDFQPPEPEDAPSIYALIRAQLKDSPEDPLDTDGFPPIRELESSGIQLAPGLADQRFGGPEDEGDGWRTVLAVVRGVNDGSVSSWAVADLNLRCVAASGHVDRVLSELSRADITPTMKATFWEVARRSRSYESVKWGIALGGIDLTEEETTPLLILARHPEFTLYASHVLERESEERTELRGKFLELLPLSRQWGAVNVINYIVRDPRLIAEPLVQRAIVVYGMENNDGIPMEVAFTIASAIDFDSVFAAATNDERLFHAVVDLVGTLIHDPAPLGGLTDLSNQREIYLGFRKLLNRRTTTVASLSGWQSLARLLSDDELDWNDSETQLNEVREALAGRVSEKVVAEGLSSKRDRWVAMGLVKDFGLTSLLPLVRNAFDESPDFKSIDILASLGGTQGRLHLLRAIPTLVDLSARSNIEMRDYNSFGPEHRYTFEYAQIVSHIGDLASEEAIAILETAIEDYDPNVREAACSAAASLPLDRVSDALKASLAARKSDSSEYVAKAARAAWGSLRLAK